MGVGIIVIAHLLLSAADVHAQPVAETPHTEDLVQQLRDFPASFPAGVRSDGTVAPLEERRRAVYVQLRTLGSEALPALARGLSDADVRIRRNVALFLGVAAGGWSEFSRPKLDIEPVLPALIPAVADTDPRVRQLAAQAIGAIGPAGVSAVPSLVRLLADSDEGSRNSACIALRGIGPPAKEALEPLRKALSDPSADVRQFAQRAIQSIEGR